MVLAKFIVPFLIMLAHMKNIIEKKKNLYTDPNSKPTEPPPFPLFDKHIYNNIRQNELWEISSIFCQNGSGAEKCSVPKVYG